ncbi:MAG: hypothetical protein ACLPYZ_01545 [Limisphaerales bacterium]
MFDWFKRSSGDSGPHRKNRHNTEEKPIFRPATLPLRRPEPSHISIRDTLFGDMPLDQWPRDNVQSDVFPWSAFVSARLHLAAGHRAAAATSWRQVLDYSGLESRQYLQAWHFLKQQGQTPPPNVAKQVLGVVVEVAMPNGLDLLAAYPDHSARYYNYSGAGVVWERPDSSLDSAIDQLLEASRQVVSRIGPWEQVRPAPPPCDQARLSFLTPSGLHFGQGPEAALLHDPLSGPVFHSANVLMKALIAKSNVA